MTIGCNYFEIHQTTKVRVLVINLGTICAVTESHKCIGSGMARGTLHLLHLQVASFWKTVYGTRRESVLRN